MARFRVLAGKHSAKVDTGKKDDEGKAIKVLKVYRRGEVVETDRDLISIFGNQKFELVRGSSAPDYDAAYDTPSVAPGGQVSSGKQMATPDGGSAAFAGPHSPDTVTHPRDPAKGGQVAQHEGMPKGAVPPAGQHKAQQAQSPPAPQKGVPANLDTMSDADLNKYAEEEEIDLKGARNRADRIKAIRTARGQ